MCVRYAILKLPDTLAVKPCDLSVSRCILKVTRCTYPSYMMQSRYNTESTTSASFLDLLLSIGRDGQLHTSIYDKRDFNFHITNFPFLSSNIPSSPAYGVFISQLIRYARACSSYECFILRTRRLSSKRLEQGYLAKRFEIVIQEVLWSIWRSYSAIWSIPLTNVKWHSDPWLRVTSQPIRLHQLHDLDTELDLHRLWVVSMEYLLRVWHARRERLPFWTPGSVPHCGTCLCSNCWDQIPRTCHVFTRFFHLEYPSVLSRLCLQDGASKYNLVKLYLRNFNT